jgi:hypothetical protein
MRQGGVVGVAVNEIGPVFSLQALDVRRGDGLGLGGQPAQMFCKPVDCQVNIKTRDRWKAQ